MSIILAALNAVNSCRYLDAANLFAEAENGFKLGDERQRKVLMRLARLRCLLMAGTMQELKILLLKTLLDRDFAGDSASLTGLQFSLALEELELDTCQTAVSELDRLIRADRSLGRSALLAFEAELRIAEGNVMAAIAALERAWVQIPVPGAFCPAEVICRMTFMQAQHGDLIAAKNWAAMLSPDASTRVCCQIQSLLARLEVATAPESDSTAQVAAIQLDRLLPGVQSPNISVHAAKLICIAKLKEAEGNSVPAQWWVDKWLMFKRGRASRRTNLLIWLAIANVRLAAADKETSVTGAEKEIHKGRRALAMAKKAAFGSYGSLTAACEASIALKDEALRRKCTEEKQ
jgi:hypothetical protein